MIEPAPVPAGDLLDWLHEQGKQRAEAVPEFDVEVTLARIREEPRPVTLAAPHTLSDAGVVLRQLAGSGFGLAGMSTVAAVAVWEAPPQPPFSPRPVEPTVRRRVLGGQLRRLREDAATTTEQAAAAICGSHAKISQMEHGRVAFRERDIADLLTLYGVTAEERQALLKLAQQADTPGWWQGYSDLPTHWMKPYLGLEAAATFIRTYEPQFVPALLQTESYARALTPLESTADFDVRCRADARPYRQEILRREDPPRLWAVIDESALRRSVGGKAVMREQIRHLIDVCDPPAVTLQILPFRTGTPPAIGGPFTLLRFSDPDLRDVVYIEQLTSAIYPDTPAEVDCYLEVMERLCLQAMDHSETPEMLRNILAET